MFEGELQRNPEDGAISGVCAGLARYIGIDKIFVYVVLIGLTLLGLFFLPIIYLALWLLLPIEDREELEMGDRIKIGFDEMRSKGRSTIDGIMDKVSKLGVSN